MHSYLNEPCTSLDLPTCLSFWLFRLAFAAEERLKAAQVIQGHLLEVLKLVASSDASHAAVRQAAAVHFKNIVKNGWAENREDGNDGIVISVPDRNTVKSHLVQLMSTTPPQIQAQLSESISLIAEVDYPQNWHNLLPELVREFSSIDPAIVNGVLKTADSIFRRFRYVGRSDDLYRVILYTLQGMQSPLLTLLVSKGQAVEAAAKDANQLKLHLESLRLICSIIYSLNYQDLPEFFEDHMKEFMNEYAKYLEYKNPVVTDPGEETEPSPIDELQSAVIKILHLYGNKDEEPFLEYLPQVTTLVWNLLVGLTPLPKHDTLATTSINYLNMLIQRPMHRGLFQAEETLRKIFTEIVIPNIRFRPSDEERFEDDPREYISTEVEGSDSQSRRKCSQSLLKGMNRQFESQITAICSSHVGSMLNEYAADPHTNWASKDAAIHLTMGIAIRRESPQAGVAELNPGVDLMDFFQKHVFPELQDSNHASRPVVKATALKFVGVFRNQFSREQLMQLIPVIIPHLSSPIVVVHTFAAYVLERILVTKEGDSKRAKVDSAELREFLNPLFTSLFAIVDNEQHNENEYVMKCVMRALAKAGQDVVPLTETVIARLTVALGRVAKNPRNPQFNHYLFESIAVLVKNACSQNPSATQSFEGMLFEPFTVILQSDIVEFTPYVFQILAQLLEYRPAGTGLGPAYTNLFAPLLSASLWEKKGNVPALARLMQAYVRKGAGELLPHLVRILAVFQKLLASRATETSAFEILNSVIVHFPKTELTPVIPEILRLLFTRLQSGRTPRYVSLVTMFFGIFAGHFGGQAFLESVEGLQQGMGAMVLREIWNPRLMNAPLTNRVEAKAHAVGLTRLLCDSPILLASDKGREAWAGALAGVVNVLTSATLSNAETTSEDAAGAEIEIGYDATFSKLVFASKNIEDPFADVADPRILFAQSLHTLMASQKAQVLALIQQGQTVNPNLSSGLESLFRLAGLSLTS